MEKEDKLPNYYAILGIVHTASFEEIKKARNALAKKSHTDTNPGMGNKKMQDINGANEVLSNSEKRKEYDPKWKKMYGNVNAKYENCVIDNEYIHPDIDINFHNINAMMQEAIRMQAEINRKEHKRKTKEEKEEPRKSDNIQEDTTKRDYTKINKFVYISYILLIIIIPSILLFTSYGEGIAVTDNTHETFFIIEQNSKYGFVNANGEVVIPVRYDMTYGWFESKSTLHAVKIGDKWGYINNFGKQVGKMNFEYAYQPNEEVALVKIKGLYGYIDNKAKLIIKPKYYEANSFYEGLAAVKIYGGAWGYINSQGEYEIEPAFQGAIEFSEGLAAVSIYDKWGYIDSKGNKTIDYKYDEAKPFVNGLAPVRKGKKWGYINTSGVEITKFQFDEADKFQNKMACVKISNLWGYIDTDGRTVIKPKYEHALMFSITDDLAAVKIGDKWGYINKKAETVIKPKYEWGFPFLEGTALVGLKPTQDALGNTTSIGLINELGDPMLDWMKTVE